MRNIEAIKERGIYDINILDDEKEIIGLTVDTKRNKFFVITPEDGIINKETEEAYLFLKNQIINKIADRIKEGKLTGDIKVYSEEILSKILPELGIYTMSEKENKENTNYEELLSLLNQDKISEDSMYALYR